MEFVVLIYIFFTLPSSVIQVHKYVVKLHSSHSNKYNNVSHILDSYYTKPKD